MDDASVGVRSDEPSSAPPYQQIFEHLPAGAVLRHGDRLIMNRAAEAMTGYLSSELPTIEEWCTALHSDQLRAIRPHDARAGPVGSTGSPLSLTITRKDGQTRHVTVTFSSVNETHELWTLLDMTERDLAAVALRESEDYLHSIIASAVDAIITIDRNGAIQTFNPAAERMFGYRAPDVVGQNVRMLMPQPYHDEHDGYIAKYLKTGEARIIGIGREVVGLRKDRTTFPLGLAVSQFSRVSGFTGILRDVSDRRKLESQLAEIQLEERRHMAQELHDDIGGHMTGIGLLAHTLHARLVKEESLLALRAQDLLAAINAAHTELRSAIRGLMPVDVMPEGLMVALEHFAKQSSAVYQLSCEFQCEKPVHVDDPIAALHLFRIAQEAVNNAARHGKPGHITISLGATADRLQIVVADDGQGFDKMSAGRGIGLESMRHRAQLLGGDLVIEPRDGGGTTVTCWVPRPETAASRGARTEGGAS